MAEAAPKKTGFQSLIDTGATLANGVRVAADISKATRGNATVASARLKVQYDSGPPTAGDEIAELYRLRGDGETPTEGFPTGGDGTTGADVTPDSKHLVGVFRAVQPSLSVDETLTIDEIV